MDLDLIIEIRKILEGYPISSQQLPYINKVIIAVRDHDRKQ